MHSPAAQPGRRPTLTDVAARAGVSRSTASLVIRAAAGPSAASRELVLRAAAELGYRPDPAAQLLRRHRSRLLGVLFSAHDPFHADLLDSIYPAAEKLRYDVLLSALVATRDERTAVDALLASRCEGLILLGSTAGPPQLTSLARRLPVVTVGAPGTEAPVDTLHTADGEGARLAVEHLVSLGHRQIAHIDGGRQPGATARRRGYRQAIRRHGLTPRVIPGGDTEATGARAAELLLDSPDPPTAIFAFNDRCAVGVLDLLRRRGVAVPDRISVVGYDDSQPARLTLIDLTTVRQDAHRLAELAVQAVAERLDDGRATPRDTLLEPSLIARRTSGPPPAQPGSAR